MGYNAQLKLRVKYVHTFVVPFHKCASIVGKSIDREARIKVVALRSVTIKKCYRG